MFPAPISQRCSRNVRLTKRNHLFSSRPPGNLSEVEKAQVDILRSDLEVMRAQVYALMNFEVQMCNFALVFLGALIASLMQKPIVDFVASSPRVLLYSASVFILLGLMHIFEKFRIFETIAYIDVYVAEPLKILAGRPPLMRWEAFLNHCYFNEPLTGILARLRSALFFVPALLLSLAFFVYKRGAFDSLDLICIFVLSALAILYIVTARRFDRDLAFKLARSLP